MARARSAEPSDNEGDVRGAAAAAPRSTTPLKLVEAAVAGDDLQSVARAAAVALSCTVAIALPAYGLSVQWPASASPSEALRTVEAYAAELLVDGSRPAPPQLSHAVPVRLGEQLVGVAAAFSGNGRVDGAEAWLEAAAAAAAVSALMRRDSDDRLHHARRSFLQLLEGPDQVETEALLVEAQRLGYDVSHGAVAVGAALDPAHEFNLGGVAAAALLADVGDERLLGLIPLAADGDEVAAEALLSQLRAAGLPLLAAAPRRSAAELQDALREAAMLIELALDERAGLGAHEETFRLLVSVLTHSPDELRALHAGTIAPLERYDSGHDTELVATLETFLSHHGSTTDTAETMQLHRHTVGYRLARVHEVSGHSPYESEGRERLSLGLKAKRILLAEDRRMARLQRGGELAPARPTAPPGAGEQASRQPRH